MGGRPTKLFAAKNLSTISTKRSGIDYSTFAKDTHLKLKDLNSRLIRLAQDDDCGLSGKISQLEEQSNGQVHKFTQVLQQVTALENDSRNQIEKFNDYSEFKANTEQLKISIAQTSLKHDNQRKLLKNELTTISQDIVQIYEKFDKFDERALGSYSKSKSEKDDFKEFMNKFDELEGKYTKINQELENQRGGKNHLNEKYEDCQKDLAAALERIKILEKGVISVNTPKIRRSGNMIKRDSSIRKSSNMIKRESSLKKSVKKQRSPGKRLNLENISPNFQPSQGRKRGRIMKVECCFNGN